MNIFVFFLLSVLSLSTSDSNFTRNLLVFLSSCPLVLVLIFGFLLTLTSPPHGHLELFFWDYFWFSIYFDDHFWGGDDQYVALFFSLTSHLVFFSTNTKRLYQCSYVCLCVCVFCSVIHHWLFSFLKKNNGTFLSSTWTNLKVCSPLDWYLECLLDGNAWLIAAWYKPLL